MSTKTVTNATEWVFNGFKNKCASLCAGVHVCLSVCKPFFIVTFVTEPVGQFQQKITKSILEKRELKSVKINGHAFF